MTDDEYRAFLDVLFRKYVRPRLPRVRRRFHHHMEDEWRYHLNQAERAAQVLRYIENYCDDDGDIYGTFNVDRLTSAVDDTRSSLDFGNKTIEEAGFLDAYDLHANEILAGLRPEHLPEADKELLKEMGSPDADAELTELVFRVRANRERVVQAVREVSVRQQLHNIDERLAKAQQDFKIRVMGESDQAPTESSKKSRRWFKGLGQIGQGAALSIANVALAIGAIHFPVSAETRTWGALASVATGIGAVLSGAGDLRNE